MSALTQDELQEIANFEKAVPTLFTGFLIDDSPRGRSNATLIAGFLEGRSQKYTVANLTNAVIELQFVLSWAPGTEPIAGPSDTRSKAQRAHEAGITTHRDTHSDTSPSGWEKDIRAGQAANAARFAAKAKADIRFRETHQQLVGPDGRVSHAQSEAANKIAAARHAAEDGMPVRQTGPRSIPSSETDPNYQAWLRTASVDEIKIYLSRKDRSHLMR